MSLGNPWGQSWESLMPILNPHSDVPDISTAASEALKNQNYTPRKMFHLAEDFFYSLGLPRMTPSFWNKSIIEKPKDNRSMNCHATAFDMGINDDFR